MYQGYRDGGYKECHRCEDVLPLTTGFFYMEELADFSSLCKTCHLIKREIDIKANADENKLLEFRIRRGTPYQKVQPKTSVVEIRQKNRDIELGWKKKQKALRVRAVQEKKSSKAVIRYNPRRSLRAGVVHDFTSQDWRYALEYFHHCCAACGRQMNDMFGEFYPAKDHFVPISKGGDTIPENIIPLCHGVDGCNNKKSNQDPAVWLTETFGTRKAAVILARIAAFFASVRPTRRDKAS